MKNLLLIIDAQKDFVESTGSLTVPGAQEALGRLEKFIRENKTDIDDILLTKDSHYPTHIGLPRAWEPMAEELSVITTDMVKEGKVAPRFLDKDEVLTYLSKIEEKGEVHHIWPEHCICGSEGQQFPRSLIRALTGWSEEKGGKHWKVLEKGMNDGAEMYSALSYADGQERGDLGRVLEVFSRFDCVFVAGFAKDFCVRSTLQDIMEGGLGEKLVLLDDCMTSINPDCEVTKKVWEKLREQGAKIIKEGEA